MQQPQEHQVDQSIFFHVKLWFRIFLGSALLVLTCGIFFGYPALKPILINEGVYANLCTAPVKNETIVYTMKENRMASWIISMDFEDEEHEWLFHPTAHASCSDCTVSGSFHMKNSSAVPLCEKQNLKLNSISTAAIAGLNAFALPVGIVVDLVNPRLLVMSSSLLWCLGFIAFGQSDSAKLDLYIPSVIAVAITGGVLFMCLIRLKQYLKSSVQQSLVMGILNAMWDLSSVTPWIFNLIYFHTGITARNLFSWYSLLAIPSFIYGLIHLPFGFEMNKSEEEYSGLLDESDMKKSDEKPSRYFMLLNITSYLKTYWITVWNGLDINLIFLYFAMASGTLSMSLFMSTVTDQIRYIERSEKKIGYMIDTLSLMLPILGTMASILTGQTVGLIKKIAKHPYTIIFSGLLLAYTGWTILSLIPVPGVQYATFVIFVIWRISFFVVFSEYFLSRYGIFSFYALGLTIAGCVSFSASGWNKLAQVTFKGNFFVVNTIVGSVNLIAGLLLILMIEITYRRSNRMST